MTDITDAMALLDEDEARELLAAIRETGPSFTTCELVAELLVEKRELEAALTWYDLAISLLPEEDRTSPGEHLSLAGHALAARRGVRALLGHPADADDLAAPLPPVEYTGFPGLTPHDGTRRNT